MRRSRVTCIDVLRLREVELEGVIVGVVANVGYWHLDERALGVPKTGVDRVVCDVEDASLVTLDDAAALELVGDGGGVGMSSRSTVTERVALFAVRFRVFADELQKPVVLELGVE